jgi:uncharacterized phage protein (TIGR01671 family)
MKEYKFRAWDKEEYEMLQVDCIDFFKKEILDQRNDIHSFENIELMQCIGLKDKNGKELYFDDFTKMNDKIYQIIELNGAVAFVEPTTLLFWEYACNLATCKFGKYCGNIYEHSHLLDNNPELLK